MKEASSITITTVAAVINIHYDNIWVADCKVVDEADLEDCQLLSPSEEVGIKAADELTALWQ